ncbi:MAG: hypothetical protein JW727_05350, partial [Candidatus Aenigmarchaeota archaeon]|nr:hypothetical protein [Candidatus Aenigmarchaeota archaeon]
MPEPSRIVEIYMIGYGVNGKWAFQEIVKLCKTNDFIIFRGLAEINPDTRRQAAAEAEAHGINLQIFDHTLDMYQSASLSKNLIMVYDCGPSQLHYSHLIKSAHFGFWHFTEKPPAIKRHDFEKEAEYTKWYCDVLEEENEAVLTAMEYLV